MAHIISRYNGTCYVCNEFYPRGTSIYWQSGVKGARHSVCPDKPVITPEVAAATTDGNGERMLNARFSSVCRVCGSGIAVGTPIYYTKGLKARHTHCADVPSITTAQVCDLLRGLL